MPAQTSVTSAPNASAPGMLAVNKEHALLLAAVVSIPSTLSVETQIEPGLAVFPVAAEGDSAIDVARLGAADDDALVIDTATSASIQTLTPSGAIGAGVIMPAARVTITRNTSANHSAVTAVLTVENEFGQTITENISFGAGGNQVLTSTAYASKFVSLVIPAQGGTGGLTRVGVAGPSGRTLAGSSAPCVLVRQAKGGGVMPRLNDNEFYRDAEQCAVLRKGYICVRMETAHRKGQQPYVRLIAAGAEQLGAFRAGNDDGGDCVPMVGARLHSTGPAGMAVLEIL